MTGASRLVLTGLVDKSLVSVSGEGRYDLHERLRQYLLEKLRGDLTVYQAANDRHSHVYLALLQLERAEFNQQSILQRLTADFANIRAAWHWSIDHHNWSAIRQSRWGYTFSVCTRVGIWKRMSFMSGQSAACNSSWRNRASRLSVWPQQS